MKTKTFLTSLSTLGFAAALIAAPSEDATQNAAAGNHAEVAEKILENYDQDETEGLSRTEFINAFTDTENAEWRDQLTIRGTNGEKLDANSEIARLYSVFANADRNYDGVLSAGELSQAIASLSSAPSGVDAEAEESAVPSDSEAVVPSDKESDSTDY
jgi:Ca2+-binding EF-hand superfamily protein